MRIRRNAALLPSAEQQRLVDALKALKSDIQGTRNGVNYGTYDQVVALHLGVTQRFQNGQPIGDGAHNTPAFLPWHRKYLLWLESLLRQVDGRVTIPYWPWTDVSGTQDVIFVDEFLGPSGDGFSVGAVSSGHFSEVNGWPILDELHRPRLNLSTLGTALLRRSTFNFSSLPSEFRINQILGRDVYEDSPAQRGFREDLEGDPHGRLHGWVGGFSGARVGTMSGMSSPNDPIFFLHHAAVDWLWARWQADGHAGPNFYPSSFPGIGHGLTSSMWPWDGGSASTLDWVASYLPDFGGEVVQPQDVLDSVGIGVQYDSLLPSLSIGASRSLSVNGIDDENGVRFPITASGRYRVAAQGSGNVALSLHGPNGWDVVAERSGAGNLSITADLSPGEYFAMLRGASAAAITRAVTLVEEASIVVGAPAPVTLVIGDAPVDAAIGMPGEIDEFRFAVVNTAEYTIETHGPTDVVMSLFGPNNQNSRIVQDDDTGQDRNALIRTQLTPGDYLIRVRHFFPDRVGNYQIDVRATAAPAVGDLQVGGPAVSQTINQPGEVDVLAVQVAQFGRYRFTTGGSVDTVLFISNQNNPSQVLGWNDDADGTLNSRVDIDLDTGVYNVAVRLFSSTATGDYSVAVEQVS